MMSSIFRAMPLYAWIIIGCIILALVVFYLKKRASQRNSSGEWSSKHNRSNDTSEPSQHGVLDSFFNGGKRKSKNMKKRRKYKK